MEIQTLKNKCIVLGVSGSIAAYKAAALTSMLVKAGADVHVIMTKNATQLIGPATFENLTGNRCLLETFDRNHEFKVQHISLAQRADLFIIAPASANVIAKVANGLADDMLTTTFLACTCPKIIAPAMNTAMYENPVTQDNLKKCRSYGMSIAEGDAGYLACGTSGKGRLAEPETLFAWIEHELPCKKDLAGKKILVTAGPTQESLDPVRYITNHSSGKMGYAVAKAASRRGAEVTLVSGPVALKELPFVNTVHITSAAQMAEAVKDNFFDSDILIKAAAVADYRPANVSDQKIKKHDDDLNLPLERTEDILAWCGKNKKSGQFLCGFSMETQNMVENSKAKLVKKNLDLIAANSLSSPDSGFAVDTNVLTLISPSSTKELPVMQKEEAADCLLDEIVLLMEQRQ